MNNEINKWNIIIENNKLDELNKNIDELQTENTNLKIELNAKKELKDAHSYMNNKIIETNSSYLYDNSKNIPFIFNMKIDLIKYIYQIIILFQIHQYLIL